MICNDCEKEYNETLKNGICHSCSIRKGLQKEKYIPYKELPEEEKIKLESRRKYSSDIYHKNKEKMEFSNNEELDELIDNDTIEYIKKGFIEAGLDETIDIDYDLDLLKSFVSLFQNIGKPIKKEEYDKQRQDLSKKIRVFDKYVEDILHDLENLSFVEDVDEVHKLEQLYGKKLRIIRTYRRRFRNKDEILRLTYKLQNLLIKPEIKITDTLNEIVGFIRAIENGFYNRAVEDSRDNKKLLGLFKFRCNCDIVSNTSDRKIIKINEIVQAKDQNEAKENLINVLRNRYGESVIWSKVKISKLGR